MRVVNKKEFTNGSVYALRTSDGYPLEATDTHLPSEDSLKHWKYDEFDKMHYLNAEDGNRVLSVEYQRGKVYFGELCDGRFQVEILREDAIAALREMADYLETIQ